MILDLGVKRLAINSIRLGPLYSFPDELKLVGLDPKDDLEVELELESELVEEIENEVGSLGLTWLCPAVEEELSGGEGAMTRVPWSSALEAVIVRRKSIVASILDLTGWRLSDLTAPEDSLEYELDLEQEPESNLTELNW